MRSADLGPALPPAVPAAPSRPDWSTDKGEVEWSALIGRERRDGCGGGARAVVTSLIGVTKERENEIEGFFAPAPLLHMHPGSVTVTAAALGVTVGLLDFPLPSPSPPSALCWRDDDGVENHYGDLAIWLTGL